MNILALVPVILLAIGLFWALWLIFKRDLLAQNLGKLVSYFLGVIITFGAILWLVGQFLPWWTVRLLQDTRQSPEVRTIQQVGREIWGEVMTTETSPDTTVYETPQQPSATEVPAEQGSGAQSATQGTQGETFHTVQSGDTLYNISQRYGVSQQLIKQRNSLSSDTIRIGQKLVIPAP